MELNQLGTVSVSEKMGADLEAVRWQEMGNMGKGGCGSGTSNWEVRIVL